MAMYSDAELEALMSDLESDLVERKESAADGKKIRRNLGFAQWAVWNVRLEAAAWKSKNRSAEARTKLPEVLTKRGEPYAAVVPVSQALREAPCLSDLRGSANGCYGNAGAFVGGLRDEWR